MSTNVSDFSKSEAAERPAFITNLTELIDFRDKVNIGEDFKGKQIIQVCTIEDLKDWTPIGTMEHPFRGIYSGQNEVFKNITVQSNGVAGLFGCIEGALLKMCVSEAEASREIRLGAFVVISASTVLSKDV